MRVRNIQKIGQDREISAMNEGILYMFLRKKMMTPLLACVLAMGSMSLPVLANHQVDSMSVNKGSTHDLVNSAEIVIATNAEAKYSLFRLSNPNRIVIDLPQTDVSQFSVPKTSPKSHLIAAITASQYQGNSTPVGRIIIVLRDQAELETVTRGHSIVMTLKRIGQQSLKTSGKSKRLKVSQRSLSVKNGPQEKSSVIILDGSGDIGVKRASRFLGIKASKSGAGSLVKIKTNGEVVHYEIKEVGSPPRLVLDLWGVKARKYTKKNLNIPALKKYRVGKYADRTRIVLEGYRNKGLQRYDIASTDEGITLIFDPNKKDLRQNHAEVRAAALHQKKNFYRLQIDANDAISMTTLVDSPREKVVLFEGVHISQELLHKRLATMGPIEDVTFLQSENPSAFKVSLKTNADIEQSLWQKDGHVYWDIRSKVQSRIQPKAAGYETAVLAAAHQGSATRKYKGKRINISLQDADVVNVIRLIGDVAGRSVVIGEDVKGKVTLKLRNVPWDQAFDVILRSRQLGKEVKGGIIRVAPRALLDSEKQKRLALVEESRNKEQTFVRLIPVNYAVAEELVAQVKSLLTKRGKVTFDGRTNVIIVEDIKSKLAQADKLIRTLDTQTPLVHIEARMVESTTSFSRSLGIQWGGGLYFSQQGGNPTGLIFPNNIGIVGGADSNATGAGLPGVVSPTNYAVNLPSQTQSSSVGMNLGAIGNYGFLNARLSAAESTGEAKIISAPKVTTLNNKTAIISQGIQIPITVTTNQQIQTTIIEAKLELNVTPHVTADGSILMALKITNDAPQPNKAEAAIPTISTKHINTEMLIQDGDTAVIGGIYTRTYGEAYSKTPFLGDIPLLGWLFKSYSTSDERNEMLVFITPRIVNKDAE